jgi:hypothetical protein
MRVPHRRDRTPDGADEVDVERVAGAARDPGALSKHIAEQLLG